MLADTYDLKYFLRIPYSLQQERILRRNGEQGLKMFESRWIPLEEKYFAHFALPDSSCILYPTDFDRS
ncbi:MAG: hypothetical protein Q4C54_09470 [Clostridia bacterium]|nr:hypothetical protein [Clostridia bacterium]